MEQRHSEGTWMWISGDRQVHPDLDVSPPGRMVSRKEDQVLGTPSRSVSKAPPGPIQLGCHLPVGQPRLLPPRPGRFPSVPGPLGGWSQMDMIQQPSLAH